MRGAAERRLRAGRLSARVQRLWRRLLSRPVHGRLRRTMVTVLRVLLRPAWPAIGMESLVVCGHFLYRRWSRGRVERREELLLRLLALLVLRREWLEDLRLLVHEMRLLGQDHLVVGPLCKVRVIKLLLAGRRLLSRSVEGRERGVKGRRGRGRRPGGGLGLLVGGVRAGARARGRVLCLLACGTRVHLRRARRGRGRLGPVWSNEGHAAQRDV